MTLQIFFISIGLAMDAVAVSIINGMCNQNLSLKKNALSSGITFGIFQGFMPLIGFLLGTLFKDVVKSIDHWIALVLLGFIGLNMIREGIEEQRNPDDCPVCNDNKALILQGIATSVDALAIGIGFAVIDINIVTACVSIALVTCFLSFGGVYVGHRFGRFFADKAQFVGGGILIFLGLQIFYEHAILGIA